LQFYGCTDELLVDFESLSRQQPHLPAKDDHAAESEAIDWLLKAKDEGKVDVVTSKVTLQEIKRYRGPKRSPVERIFRLLGKIPIVRWDQVVGIHSDGDSRRSTSRL
jgi:hypothetical protein